MLSNQITLCGSDRNYPSHTDVTPPSTSFTCSLVPDKQGFGGGSDEVQRRTEIPPAEQEV